VLVRSQEHRLFSFRQSFIFFTDEPSLKISLMSPFLKDNSITNDCTVIPGVFDCGQWFRNIDFAFFLKSHTNKFTIKEKQIFYYLKFHTNEKINFIQYRHGNEILAQYLKDVHNSGKNTPKAKSLLQRYKMFKNKKNILKEIRNNLV
jgi:hypothetical protein